MKLSRSFVVFVALMLAGPAIAQPGQRQPPPPEPRAEPAPPPPAVVETRPPPSPAELEAQRRREEQSVDATELLANVSRATGMEFLVDPRVRFRVYGIPRMDNPTYAELLTILRMHGYTAVNVGGRVNILPDANVRFMPVRVLNRDDDSVPDDEYVTRVIETRNAPQLVPVLRPLMPQSAHLAAVAGEEGEPGKLILMDTYANIRRMTELIRELAQ
jgi:general secretion pathway protein D